MKPEALRDRIQVLLKQLRGAPLESFQGALSLATMVYGPSAPQTAMLRGADRNLSTTAVFHNHVEGFLRSLLGELDAGLLGNLKATATGEVLADLISLARELLDQAGAELPAAVLAAAAFEDAMRRLADLTACSPAAAGNERPKLSTVLEALRTAGVLSGPEFSMAQSHLPFRNNALHADWAKITTTATQTVLTFVEHLVLNRFQ